MKVAITAGVYWPEAGGSATYLKELRSDLEAAGHSVTIVCYGEGPSDTVVRRISRRHPIPVRIGLFTLWAVRRFRDADVWSVNDYGITATVVKGALRIPTVMKVIGDWAWESGVNQALVPVSPIGADGAFRDPLLELQRRRQHPRVELRKTLRSRAARAMDRVIVPSEYLRSVVEGWGVRRERIAVIYNGIARAASEPVRQERVEGLIVAVARLVAWKGIDHLIQAMPVVRDRSASARLIIIGDGPDRARLEHLAASSVARERIVFTGHLERTEVDRWLRKARAFALPSAYEGLPHVVLEAMRAGCPVVAAGAGGTPEVVRDEIDGLLIPYGSPARLGAALARVLTEDDLAARLSAAGVERVSGPFSWGRTSAATISLLKDTARRSRS